MWTRVDWKRFSFGNPECCCLPSASGKDYFEKKSQNNVRQILPSNQESLKKYVKSTFSIVGSGGKIRVGDLPGGIWEFPFLGGGFAGVFLNSLQSTK